MSVKISPIKILSDLGFEMVDIETDKDYLSALREGINTIEAATKGSGDRRSEALREELIRVRREKKADPKFNLRIKKTTVSPEKIMGQKMLPPAKLDPKKLSSQGGGGDTLSQILVSVTSIRDILINQIKQKRDDAKKKRRATENVKRKDKESGLEILKKGFGAVKSGAEKIIGPVKGLFKEVLDFIGKVVFGRVLFKLFEWFTDKKNQDKVKAIGKFLKKTWPVMLAAYLLFGNAFGRMAVKLGVMITKFSIRLITKIIPALIKAIAKMKMGKMLKGGLIAGGIMTAGYMMTRDGGKDDETGDGEWTTLPSVVPRNFEDAYSEEDQAKINEMLKKKNFNKGGQVPGSGNTDTVPAMLTPGEFVMSKGAVQKFGADTLAGMNAAAGGTNEPEMMVDTGMDGVGLGGLGADTLGADTLGGVVQGFNSGGLVTVKPGSINSYQDAIDAGIEVEDIVTSNSRFGSIKWKEPLPRGLFGLGKKRYEIKGTKWMFSGTGSDVAEKLAIPTEDYVNMKMGWSKSSKSSSKTSGIKNLASRIPLLGSVSNAIKDKYKVRTPVKKSVVQAYEDEKSKIVALGGGNTTSKSKGGNDLPNIDAAEKRSVHKIKTLGISV